MPNCLSGSPSCSSRMFRRTLSRAWLTTRTGDAAGDEALGQLVAVVRARRPAVVEHREPRRMGSDNVHPFHRTGSARLSRGLDLRGAVVVVTGASSGFGELTSLRFARAGSSRRACGPPARAPRGARRPGSRRAGASPSPSDATSRGSTSSRALARPRRRGVRTLRRAREQRRDPRRRLVRGGRPPPARAGDRGEPPRPGPRHEAVPAVDARAPARARREHRVARGPVRDTRREPSTGPRSTGSSRSARPCTTSSARAGSWSRA